MDGIMRSRDCACQDATSREKYQVTDFVIVIRVTYLSLSVSLGGAKGCVAWVDDEDVWPWLDHEDVWYGRA